MTRRELPFHRVWAAILLLMALGFVLGLLSAPALLGIPARSTAIEQARADAVMRTLACAKKNPRELPTDGRPCL
ncbi:MAG: hypothetical protein ACK50D_11425 [Burkholderiales bacterium]|jgi:hypothetical protein